VKVDPTPDRDFRNLPKGKKQGHEPAMREYPHPKRTISRLGVTQYFSLEVQEGGGGATSIVPAGTASGKKEQNSSGEDAFTGGTKPKGTRGFRKKGPLCLNLKGGLAGEARGEHGTLLQKGGKESCRTSRTRGRDDTRDSRCKEKPWSPAGKPSLMARGLLRSEGGKRSEELGPQLSNQNFRRG